MEDYYYSTYHPYAGVYRRPLAKPFPQGVSLGTTGISSRSAASRLLDLEYDFPSKFERRSEINRLKSKRRLEALDFGLLPYNSWSTYLKPFRRPFTPIPRYYINDNRDYYLGDYYPMVVSRYPVRPLRMVQLAPLSYRAIPIADSSIDALTLDIETEERRIQDQHEAKRIQSAVWQSEASDRAIKLCKDRNRIRNQLRRIENARMVAPIYCSSNTFGSTLGTRHKVLINYHKGAAAAAHKEGTQDGAEPHVPSDDVAIGQRPKKEIFRDDGTENVTIPLPKSPTREVITNGFVAEQEAHSKTAEEPQSSFSVGEPQVELAEQEQVPKKKKSKIVEPVAEVEVQPEKKSKPKREHRYESSRDKAKNQREPERKSYRERPDTTDKPPEPPVVQEEKHVKEEKVVPPPEPEPQPEPETQPEPKPFIVEVEQQPVEQEPEAIEPPSPVKEEKVIEPPTEPEDVVSFSFSSAVPNYIVDQQTSDEPEPDFTEESKPAVDTEPELEDLKPKSAEAETFSEVQNEPFEPEAIYTYESPVPLKTQVSVDAEIFSEVQNEPFEPEFTYELPVPLKKQVSIDEPIAQAEVETDLTETSVEEATAAADEPVSKPEVSAAEELAEVPVAETESFSIEATIEPSHERQISVEDEPSRPADPSATADEDVTAEEEEPQSPTVLRRLVSTASCREGDACDPGEWDDDDRAPIDSPQIEPAKRIILSSASDDAIPSHKGNYEDEDEPALVITTEEPSTAEGMETVVEEGGKGEDPCRLSTDRFGSSVAGDDITDISASTNENAEAGSAITGDNAEETLSANGRPLSIDADSLVADEENILDEVLETTYGQQHDSNVEPQVEEPDEETEKYDENADYRLKSLSIEEDG